MADSIESIESLFTESGDDLYLKPSDSDFGGSNWGTSCLSAIEESNNYYKVTRDDTKFYRAYQNLHRQEFTANATTDVITAAAHGLANGETVRFKGADLPAGLTQVTIYYVRDVTTDTFKVSATAGGSAVNITDAGSGVMTITAPSKRSSSDFPIGRFDQIRDSSLTGEGEDSLVDKIVASAVGVNAAIAATQATTAATQASSANTKLGTPAGVSVSADVAAVKTGVDGVVKSGESRSVSRTGKTTVTFTETRA